MQHSKNMLTKKIKEKSSIQGIVVSSRRVYVYSDEIDQEIEKLLNEDKELNEENERVIEKWEKNVQLMFLQ